MQAAQRLTLTKIGDGPFSPVFPLELVLRDETIL